MKKEALHPLPSTFTSTHLTGSLRLAAANNEAATTAAPPMSALIRPIWAAGLMEMPPVSKVTPNEVEGVSVSTKAVFSSIYYTNICKI